LTYLNVSPANEDAYQAISGPPQVDRSEIAGYPESAPAFINQFLEINGRFFQLGVGFGQADPTDDQIATVNSVLNTITVSSN
jgi:hypothetical protein